MDHGWSQANQSCNPFPAFPDSFAVRGSYVICSGQWKYRFHFREIQLYFSPFHSFKELDRFEGGVPTALLCAPGLATGPWASWFSDMERWGLVPILSGRWVGLCIKFGKTLRFIFTGSGWVIKRPVLITSTKFSNFFRECYIGNYWVQVQLLIKTCLATIPCIWLPKELWEWGEWEGRYKEIDRGKIQTSLDPQRHSMKKMSKIPTQVNFY